MTKGMSLSSSYEVRQVPDKGLGAIAVRKVEPGEKIIEESPLVRVALDSSGDLCGHNFGSSGDDDNDGFVCPELDRELNKLSDGDLRRFFALTDVFSGKGNKTRFGIVKTNSFCVTSSSSTYLAVFPSIARINHSCKPNCHHYWNNATGAFVVRAVEEIGPGEEITISYMSPLQRSDFHDTGSRRAILLEEFGFRCLCEICSVSDPDSDCDRKRILEIESEWSGLGMNPEAAMQMGEEQMRLCEKLKFQSGLVSYVALHCVEASSLVASSKSKSGSAIEAEEAREKGTGYARKALFHARIAYGDDSPEFSIFRSVVKACEGASDRDLVGQIQEAITSLRDIDA